MKTVYLGLGSNLGDREGALREAVHLLNTPELVVKRVSSVYETAPQDKPGQPWFLNAVVEAETSLFPVRLLTRVANIERQMGRKRLSPKGPRTIDIDILLHGHAIVHSAQLCIPHPRMMQRRFVLEPLAELAPDLRHPDNMRSIRDLLNETLSQTVRKTDIQIGAPFTEPRA